MKKKTLQFAKSLKTAQNSFDLFKNTFDIVKFELPTSIS